MKKSPQSFRATVHRALQAPPIFYGCCADRGWQALRFAGHFYALSLQVSIMYSPLNTEPPVEPPPTTAWGVERGEKIEARRSLGPSRSRKATKVKMQDVYSFNLEVSREEALIIHQVKERVKEQGRVWWAMEAKNGAGWYLQPEIFAQAEGYLASSLSLVTMTNSMQLKKLIRSGIPPPLRPRVWSAVSGATKRKSTVPGSYYQDLLAAVEGRETPATRQIDHVSTFHCAYISFRFDVRESRHSPFLLT